MLILGTDMDSSVRRTRGWCLATLGRTVGCGWAGLLVACQGPAETVSVTPRPAPPSPAAAGGGPTAGAVASPAASPVAAASPSPAVAASPAPAALGLAGKPMYQMDAQHSGRSPHAGPRQVRLLRAFDTSRPEL